MLLFGTSLWEVQLCFSSVFRNSRHRGELCLDLVSASVTASYRDYRDGEALLDTNSLSSLPQLGEGAYTQVQTNTQ